MSVDSNDLLAMVGKIMGGALVVGGGAWATIRQLTKDRRNDGVANAEAVADRGAFSAYSGTIAMLQQQVDRMRADHETETTRWRAAMDALDARLKSTSDLVDAAVARARIAEDNAAKLRSQLRSLNVEPVA